MYEEYLRVIARELMLYRILAEERLECEMPLHFKTYQARAHEAVKHYGGGNSL